MLNVVRLGFLLNELEVHQILAQKLLQSSSACLETCSEMVGLVLDLASWREKEPFVRHEFPFIVSFGLAEVSLCPNLSMTTAFHLRFARRECACE